MNSPIIVWVMACITAGSVALIARGVTSADLLGVTGSGIAGERYGWRSDDMDERGEATLRSETSDVEENCLLSLSFAFKADKAPGDAECCA